MRASLYLIPATLGDTDARRVLPDFNREVVRGLRYFIVEDVRSARRFLKKVDPELEIDSLRFYALNEHTPPEAVEGCLEPLAGGENMGVISEAGCPAVADPGAEVVALAQQRGYRIVPLVGPSSILLALMASGFNGQCFAFNGYLPIYLAKRREAIHRAERRVYHDDQTQIFIETPYRNNLLAADLLAFCRPETKLCIASNLTLDDERIQTLPVAEWEGRLPDMNKKPTIFLIYK